ncbi:MAG: peptide chain release factor N(5)-glutamine methyltransferase [bacterium]|nr:peptide chain release factor N(5)-glutamine methyltransferase [bacterium]
MRRTPPALEQLWTVIDIVRWATDYFAHKGVDSPRLTIELMLCSVLDVQRIRLYTEHERPLLKNELRQLRSMITRRAQHEPLQYILGKADFYGLSLKVSPDVLIPRPETEILAERCIRILSTMPDARCLDVGTGSGCIAISVAVHAVHSMWVGIDISTGAVAVAQENVTQHDVAARVQIIQADIRTYAPDQLFDVLVMNPPYIPSAEVPTLEQNVRDYEPHVALTDDYDGLTFYRIIAERAAEIMKQDATILLEIGHGQSEDVKAIFQERGYGVDVLNDLENIPRVCIVRRRPITIS